MVRNNTKKPNALTINSITESDYDIHSTVIRAMTSQEEQIANHFAATLKTDFVSCIEFEQSGDTFYKISAKKTPSFQKGILRKALIVLCNDESIKVYANRPVKGEMQVRVKVTRNNPDMANEINLEEPEVTEEQE